MGDEVNVAIYNIAIDVWVVYERGGVIVAK